MKEGIRKVVQTCNNRNYAHSANVTNFVIDSRRSGSCPFGTLSLHQRLAYLAFDLTGRMTQSTLHMQIGHGLYGYFHYKLFLQKTATCQRT